jgi:protoporphyrinogen oxidase
MGGGITGLTAAYRLAAGGVRVELFEADREPGGMAKMIRWGRDRLDLGPHKLFTTLPGILEEIRRLLPERGLYDIGKKSRIHLRGRFLSYPFRMTELFLRLPVLFSARMALGAATASLRRRPEKSYADWVGNRFGPSIAGEVFLPYAEKIWGPPDRLSVELAKRRIVVTSVKDVLLNMLLPGKGGKTLSADVFHYPRGGMEKLFDSMARIVRSNGGRVHLGARVVGLGSDRGRITSLRLKGGVRKLSAGDVVVSTIPLPELAEMACREAAARESARALSFRDLALVYLRTKRPVSDDNWIFFPSPDVPFNRTFEQRNFSPDTMSGKGSVVTAEVTAAADPSVLSMKDSALAELCARSLSATGLVPARDITDHRVVRVPRVYPVWDLHFRRNLDAVLAELDRLSNLYTVGRQGLFNYTGMTDCMDMGIRTAEFLLSGSPRAGWPTLRRSFDHYIVID